MRAKLDFQRDGRIIGGKKRKIPIFLYKITTEMRTELVTSNSKSHALN
jgi:hypothetical protein